MTGSVGNFGALDHPKSLEPGDAIEDGIMSDDDTGRQPTCMRGFFVPSQEQPLSKDAPALQSIGVVLGRMSVWHNAKE